MDIDSLPKLRCPKCSHSRTFRVDVAAQAIIENGKLYQYSDGVASFDAIVFCNNCSFRAELVEFRNAEIKHAYALSGAKGDALSRL